MELMQKKEIKKPKQNHTSDISFMQILKKNKDIWWTIFISRLLSTSVNRN